VTGHDFGRAESAPITKFFSLELSLEIFFFREDFHRFSFAAAKVPAVLCVLGCSRFLILSLVLILNLNLLFPQQFSVSPW